MPALKAVALCHERTASRTARELLSLAAAPAVLELSDCSVLPFLQGCSDSSSSSDSDVLSETD